MPTGYAQRSVARVLSIVALAAAFVAVAAILLSASSGSYVIHARFQDAGQLVVGDQVQLGGHPVGSVTDISITHDGLADVRLRIDDGALVPLHLGTTATIGSPGLSGVANRYVRIDPGPGDAPKIGDGGVLSPLQTHGIVDIDMLIDGFDQPTRMRLRTVLREAADAFAAPGGQRWNRAFEVLNPALSRSAALGRELVADQGALSRLVRTAADVSTTLAARRGQLGHGVAATAAVLGDVAAHRRSLQAVVQRAPAVLRQATGVLARTRTTLIAADPAVRHLAPVAPLAAQLLREVLPVARNAQPAIAQLRALLPAASSTLALLPQTARTTVPALRSGATALARLRPIITGLRPYTPDLLAGLFEGFNGDSSGYYDANGHFARIMLANGPGQATGGVAGSAGAAAGGAAPGYRTGVTARCPGGATDPAPDLSNPFVPADAKDLCDPAQVLTP
jgi:phospholipid/cholesterol/gamma-HCH transport system substrate-binding protein